MKINDEFVDKKEYNCTEAKKIERIEKMQRKTLREGMEDAKRKKEKKRRGVK